MQITSGATPLTRIKLCLLLPRLNLALCAGPQSGSTPMALPWGWRATTAQTAREAGKGCSALPCSLLSSSSVAFFRKFQTCCKSWHKQEFAVFKESRYVAKSDEY